MVFKKRKLKTNEQTTTTKNLKTVRVTLSCHFLNYSTSLGGHSQSQYHHYLLKRDNGARLNKWRAVSNITRSLFIHLFISCE